MRNGCARHHQSASFGGCQPTNHEAKDPTAILIAPLYDALETNQPLVQITPVEVHVN